MIPYFSITTIHLGPIPIQVWGTFVALGIVLGAWWSARFAARRGLDPDIIWRGASWIIIASFIGARLLHVLAYEPVYYWQAPLEALKFWQGGFSIMGGFAGAIAGFALFTRRVGISWAAYADTFIYGLPLGMACGRIGCFLIHDHPGTLTDSVLGVRYPDGQTRHDLGLYEALVSAVLAAVFAALARRKVANTPFFFSRLFLVGYGVARFLLDFLRAVDQTYLGLTPAQYASLAMVIAAVAWTWRLRPPTLEQGKGV